jgi:DNA-binding NarL/FixJ family response regulator
MARRNGISSPAEEVVLRADCGSLLARVVLCDDQEIFRFGLRTVIDAEPDLRVVAEFNSAAAMFARADQLDYDVVIIGQRLLCTRDDEFLRAACRCGAVLILAESDSELELVRSLRAGVRGYLPRGLSTARLLDGIRTLGKDEPAFDPVVARHLLHYLIDGVREPARTVLDQLTERQRTVALLAADGLTNEEIATRLNVSQATVKSHMTAALQRLSIHNRIQLVILIRNEMISNETIREA